MRAVLVLAVCVAVVAAVPHRSQKIVGGSVAVIAQYPSTVALLYSSDLSTYTQACGGTILNNRSIMSVAHCTYGDTSGRWRVRTGSSFANSGGVVYSVTSVVTHPNYNNQALNDDIAILRTASSIAFINNRVQAASIAGANYNLGDNQAVWAAGWGTTSAGGVAYELLRQVQIWTINQALCTARYAEINATVTDSMLCSGWIDVGGRGQCQGDDGGPLYHKGVVVGVYSWGQGCALAYYPGVNTRVSSFSSWIQANALED